MLHLLLALVVLFGAACSGGDAQQPSEAESTSRFSNVAEDVAFVGDAACFDCHEDLWRGYQDHGMARSYYRLTPESAVEPFPSPTFHHEGTNLTYRAFRRGDRFFQEEYRLNAAGDTTHHLVREMEFVMGSGNAARTYMSDEGGRLYELPLTWYSQGEHWEFSPGYRRQNGRFDRLVPDRCMACHNSYPESVPYVEGKYASVPEGIGCERCHGPGALHVEARLEEGEVAGEEDGSGIDPTIVNPAHLELDRQLDVCQQCHLSGTVTMHREGKGPFDYRPSQPLDGFIAMFSVAHGAEAEQIDVISHADRMKQSACFVATQATAEAMTCVTCHDPHEGFRDKGPAYFNETCLSCHAVEGLQSSVAASEQGTHTPASDCSSCHMPRVEAVNAPHASFTDHRIRVVRDDAEPTILPELLASHTAPELAPYFARDEEGPEAARYEGMAYLIYGEQKGDSAAVTQGIRLLEAVLADEASSSGEAHFLLGRALLQRGQVQRAIPYLETSVELKPDVPERLNALAHAYEADRHESRRVAELYEQALAIQPALTDVRVSYGRLLNEQGRQAAALEQYRRAATEQPWLASAHYNLGTALLQGGEAVAASRALEQAVALEPDHVDALVNLAGAWIVQQQYEEAAGLLERAVEREPKHVAALGNLGLIYAQLGRYQEARQRLMDVLALTPDDARARAALAQVNQLMNESS